MKSFLSFAIVLILIISCQKEINDETAGIDTGDYQPVTAGSEWNYTSSSAGSYKTKSLGTDTMINGRLYYEFDNISSSGSVRAYKSKSGGVYRQFGNFAPANQVIDLIYLKDTAVGTSWTNTITVNGFKNYHKYTVNAKDIQRTVNGKIFENVIELNYEFSLDNPLGGSVINAGGGKNYYAKNVGAIEAFFTIGFLGFNLSDTTRLLTYTIK